MRPRVITGLGAAATIAAAAVIWRFPPAQYSFYPRCPFYAATHLLCPGCGATRALGSLLHADWRGAWHYNALFTLLAPGLVLGLAFICYHGLRHDRFPHLAVPPSAWAGLAIAGMLFAVARNTLFAF